MSTGKGALYSLCISHYVILLSYRHVFVKLHWNLYYVYIVHYRYLLLNEFVLDSYKAKLFLIYSLNFSHGNDATSLIRQSKMSLISKRNFIVFLMHACVKYFNYIFYYILHKSLWCENIIHDFHTDYQRTVIKWYSCLQNATFSPSWHVSQFVGEENIFICY